MRDANVPSISPINPDVPPELEQIVRTALARDRDVRYQTARDLGRDLTRFLYRFGRPVSEYDVAELVLGAAGAPAVRKDGLAMIGEMLDLMLLEFKSLTQADAAAGPNSLQPDLFKLTGQNPAAPSSLSADLEGETFSGLSDELEGPDLTDTPQDKAPTAWWRGLISR